jgi:hypothetical protein
MDLMSLLPWRWPKLDPQRTLAARRNYDERGGYAAWSAYCRTQMTRPVAEPAGHIDADRGFDLVPVMTPPEAGDFRDLLLRRLSKTVRSKEEIDYGEVLRFDDSSFLLPFMERILSSHMDARMIAHFRSEYFIYSYAVMRVMPAARARRAFLWHSDRGPRDFMKINLFLDPTSEHGSTTEFISRSESAALEQLGYTFGPNKRRVSDLSGLARLVGRNIRPVHPDIKAGEALVFEPANVLHRGILPDRGTRHIVSLMLAPSPIHWQEAWKVTAASRAAEENLGAWLPDAHQLFDMIGVPPPAGGLRAA